MNNRRRPRAISLTLPNTKQPIFIFNEARYLLRNVSEEGIGVWLPKENAFGLTPKTRVSGDIVVNQIIHPVTLEVVHSTKGYVGLRIVNADPALTRALHELLEPSHYATALLPTGRCGNEESGFVEFSYRAGLAAALSFWVGSTRDVKSLEVSVLGRWIAREQFGPTKTGVLPNEPKSVTGCQDELLLIHSDADPDFIQTAAQFLASVPPPLPGPLLWHFLESGEQVFVPDSLLKQIA